MRMQSRQADLVCWTVGGNGVKYKIPANTIECVREVKLDDHVTSW